MKWTRRTRRFARQRGAQWPVDYNSNADRQPVFEVLETDFGLAIAARREAGPDEYYWRITPFMLPCYTIVPRAREQNYIFTAAVPIDDLTMFGMTVFWSLDGPIRPMPVVDVDEHFRAKQTKRTITWSTANCRRRTASPVFAACASRTWRSRRTSAALSDQTREHLGASDLGVIATRRTLLKQVRALQKGHQPAQPGRRRCTTCARWP